MEKVRWDEFMVFSIVGSAILVVLVIFIVVILINYKRWAEKRDIHYSDAYEKMADKVCKIEDSTNDVIKKAADVVSAASDIVKEKKKK